jgi:diguanylate cyclase (GGDEF)-like protein
VPRLTQLSELARETRRQLWLGAGCFALMLAAALIALRALSVQATLQQHLERGQQHATAALTLQQQLSTYAAAPARDEPNIGAAQLKRSVEEIRLDDASVGAQERQAFASAVERLAEARAGAAAGQLDLASATRGPLEDASAALRLLQHVQTEALRRQQAQATELANFARQVLIGAALLTVILGLLFGVLGWRNMRANRRALGQLDQLAHEDGLTGVLNRRALDERLPVELSRALRSGSKLTVVMIDLDHFKRFNDKRGHGAGDELLRGAAQAWRRQLRPTDLLARYGGEEFTLVLPACDSPQALQLIERLRPLVPEMQTFSAGVATLEPGESDEELLRRADQALMQAKRGGRNRSVVAGKEPQMALPLRAA